MNTLIYNSDNRIKSVNFTDDMIVVDLMDGRIISVPLIFYPRLFNANLNQRMNWKIAGAGYGIYWPDIDEDLSAEGLLNGAPATVRNYASIV